MSNATFSITEDMDFEMTASDLVQIGVAGVSDVKVNGVSVVTSGVANVAVPTKTSQLTNDSGFVTNAYVKPNEGIPKTDLSASVQTSLGKADSALQSHQSLAAYRTAAEQDVIDETKGTYSKPSDGIPYTDLTELVQASLDKADSAIQQHQSLAGYATKTYVDDAIEEAKELPTATVAGTAAVYDGTEWSAQTGYGYETTEAETTVEHNGVTTGLPEIELEDTMYRISTTVPTTAQVSGSIHCSKTTPDGDVEYTHAETVAGMTDFSEDFGVPAYTFTFYTIGGTKFVIITADCESEGVTYPAGVYVCETEDNIYFTEFAWGGGSSVTKIDGKYIPIANNTASTSTTEALSANMGKELQDQINNLKNIGRFLAIWNAATGMPLTNPTTLPYAYKTGDYFRVGTVSSATPAVNYKPNGSSYTGTASTTVESESIEVGSVYYYDGSQWLIQAAGGSGTVADVQIAGTSIVDSNTGVANIPKASSSTKGVIYANGNGVSITADGQARVEPATVTMLEGKTESYRPITPNRLDKAVMEGLGNNALTWSDAYKTSARNTIGAGAPVTIEFLEAGD